MVICAPLVVGLQIVMFPNIEVCALTVPKFIVYGLTDVYAPPLTAVERTPTAGLAALPAKVTSDTPPVDQIVIMTATPPLTVVKNSTGTTRDAPAARVDPLAGKFDELKLSPKVALAPAKVILL